MPAHGRESTEAVMAGSLWSSAGDMGARVRARTDSSCTEYLQSASTVDTPKTSFQGGRDKTNFNELRSARDFHVHGVVSKCSSVALAAARKRGPFKSWAHVRKCGVLDEARILALQRRFILYRPGTPPPPDVNVATVHEIKTALADLHGRLNVAEAVVANRVLHGDYESWFDLQRRLDEHAALGAQPRIRAFGAKKLERLQARFVLRPPPLPEEAGPAGTHPRVSEVSSMRSMLSDHRQFLAKQTSMRVAKPASVARLGREASSSPKAKVGFWSSCFGLHGA
ncbi:unnamed protein product [Pedinophyceae sp. YPF-701]|nr:unnamed protein product [Pedinophyceae sp. YPF-701]